MRCYRLTPTFFIIFRVEKIEPPHFKGIHPTIECPDEFPSGRLHRSFPEWHRTGDYKDDLSGDMPTLGWYERLLRRRVVVAKARFAPEKCQK